MEKNIIKEEIIELLEVIIEQSEVISGYNGQIPQIEVDIVLSNIRELYDKYKILEKINKQHTQVVTEQTVAKTVDEPVIVPVAEEPPVKEVKAEIVEPVEKPVVPEETNEDLEYKAFEKAMLAESMAKVADFYEIPAAEEIEIKPKEKTIKATPSIFDESISTEEKKETVEEPLLTDKKSKTKKSTVDLFSAHSTVADKFKDEKKSINDKLFGANTDKSLAAKLQKNPIKDLKAAIGINEKFKFINELFEGNLQKYNDGITKLNAFKNSDDAIAFLSSLKSEFSWNENTEAFQELNDLVQRRYL
jgi:hypothetical protein